MILFVCVHNSGRSQMAEAFFNSFGVSESIAYSAGTFPGENVNQAVVTVMKELDIDLSGTKPKLLTQDMLDQSEKVITMGCNIEDACPTNMVITEDWGLDDPKGQSLDKVRSIRNQVKSKVIGLLNEMGHNIAISP